MKKALALILTICLCVPFLVACDPSTIFGMNKPKVPNILIKVEELKPGKPIDEVEIIVTFDGDPVAVNKTEWEEFFVDDRRFMESGDVIPENYWGRLNIFYYLPLGVSNEDLPITLDAPGGIYDGTGDGGTADDGRLQAWTHIVYGEESTDTKAAEESRTETPVTTSPATETEAPATETEAPATETEAPVTQAPKPVSTESEPPVTEAPKPTETEPHVHNWTVKESSPIIICDIEGWTKYVCSMCGETKTETTPAPGHKLNEGTRTEPTCTYTGSITRRCTVCGAGFIIEIPEKGHDWSEYEGYGSYHLRKCKECGAEEKENHVFDPGSITCKVCKRDVIN